MRFHLGLNRRLLEASQMPITLVPDPTYTGKGDPPLMVKADAMRKLFFEAGESVGDIARRYDVPYGRAYKAINPPRKAAGDPRSTATKPLTRKRLGELTRSQLEKIVTRRMRKGPDGKLINFTPDEEARIKAADAELAKRSPGG